MSESFKSGLGRSMMRGLGKYFVHESSMSWHRPIYHNICQMNKPIVEHFHT
jgi:hypothetical protein